MTSKDIKISLIISTYNNPDFLELVLLSVLKQKILPYEVVVADDGSTDTTRQLIQKYQQSFPTPLIHVWHVDNGYQLAKIKNRAAAKASGDYIFFIDGDLMLHPFFIYDIQQNVCRNWILVASRVFLSETYTKELVKNKTATIHLQKENIEKNITSGFRVPWLHQIIPGNKTYHGARGGLMGIFKDDYIKVNGFDESFNGWGREDSELFVRIINSGIKRKNIKFAAITYHLWHPILSRQQLSDNDSLLEKSIEEKRTKSISGIDQYL